MLFSLFLAAVAVEQAAAGPLGLPAFNKRAVFNNKANASSILERATTLPNGQYTFQAVNSGDWMVYRDGDGLGQSFYPLASATSGSPMSLEINSDGSFPSSTRIKPQAANQKCVSAQWDAAYDGGSDWAGVLYGCTVGSGTLQYTNLRPAKQWWYLLSASGTPQGGSPYYVIPVDHILDQTTRGFTDCARHTGGPPANAYSVCLEVLSDSRNDQLWDIQPVGASAPTTSPPSSPTPKPTTTKKSSTTHKKTSTKKTTSKKTTTTKKSTTKTTQHPTTTTWPASWTLTGLSPPTVRVGKIADPEFDEVLPTRTGLTPAITARAAPFEAEEEQDEELVERDLDEQEDEVVSELDQRIAAIVDAKLKAAIFDQRIGTFVSHQEEE